VAIYAKDSIPQKDTIYYAFTDCQSNLVALTDANGNIYQRLAYDPWGNRRNPNDWTQKAASTTHYFFNRGYTLHEHLDAFALINMSGRVYDPVLGTFLSPDPYVQAPDNWLNYNRYSYCLGNPLRYTDPTGKLTEDQLKFILNNAAAATKDVHYACNNAGTLISTALTKEQASAVAQSKSSDKSGNKTSKDVTQKPEAGKADADKNYVAGDITKDGNKPETSSSVGAAVAVAIDEVAEIAETVEGAAITLESGIGIVLTFRGDESNHKTTENTKKTTYTDIGNKCNNYGDPEIKRLQNDQYYPPGGKPPKWGLPLIVGGMVYDLYKSWPKPHVSPLPADKTRVAPTQVSPYYNGNK
jgi:RHS repeat-associated protein